MNLIEYLDRLVVYVSPKKKEKKKKHDAEVWEQLSRLDSQEGRRCMIQSSQHADELRLCGEERFLLWGIERAWQPRESRGMRWTWWRLCGLCLFNPRLSVAAMEVWI